MNDPRIAFVRQMLIWTDSKRLKKQVFDYPEVETIRNLSCQAGVHTSDFHLDVFLPKHQKKLLPVIIDIHGGGLVYGDKLLNQWTAAEMAQRGYCVIPLNYPLLPTVTVLDQLKVLFETLQSIETLADKFPLDLDQVYLKGDSAGGLLSILLCGLQSLPDKLNTFRFEHTFKVKALILVHPMTQLKRHDLLGYLSKPNEAINRLPDDVQRLFKNPITGIFDLPVWMVTSRNDLMFNKEASRFAMQLRKRGTKLEFHQFPYTSRPLNHIFMVTHPELSESQFLYDSLHQFLTKID